MDRIQAVKVRVFALLALGVLAASLAGAVPHERLVATTQVVDEREVFARSEPLALRFVLRNESAEDVAVLRWRTPLDGFSADLFDVRRDGEPVAYTGKLVKWGAPQAEDWVTIAAGSALTAVFDPSEVYDMSRPGRYTVRYRTELLESTGGGRGRPIAVAVGDPVSDHETPSVEAEETSFVLEGVDDGPRTQPDPGTMSLPPAYNGCSNSRQTDLRNALNAAEQMSTESRNYLSGLPVGARPGDARYREWFGAYDSARYSTVAANFVAIADAFSTKTVSFFCDCTSSAYAFVYPTRPYEIHLCNAFWSAPMTGTDSKGGTLIHEMSHFNVVAGTDDFAYGQTACRKLASKQPRKAVRNADSHEYFAEAPTN